MTDTTLQKADILETTEALDATAVEEIIFGKNKKVLKKGEYISTVGRRKTSTARVRISEASKTTARINGKDAQDYFPTSDLYKVFMAPIHKIKYPENFEITVVVSGGGMTGHAEAARHGLTRAIVSYDPDTRTPLKRLGFLKRDPRSKERKKPGLKKARKSAQWSKR